MSAQDLIDFSPVYRCLHIYKVLGSKETFETYYRKQRKKQARLVLQPPTNMVVASGYELETLSHSYTRFGNIAVEQDIWNCI